jgi:predicted metal-binding protein
MAPTLLKFGKLYCNRKTGNVPWKQFPKVLQEVRIAKIPMVK